jgi:hypothetical protein
MSKSVGPRRRLGAGVPRLLSLVDEVLRRAQRLQMKPILIATLIFETGCVSVPLRTEDALIANDEVATKTLEDQRNADNSPLNRVCLGGIVAKTMSIVDCEAVRLCCGCGR